MRILLTSPYRLWPANFGGARRTLSLAKALGGLGYSIAVLSGEPAGDRSTLAPDTQWLCFATHGQVGHFFNNSFRHTLRQTIDNFKPELIIAGFPYQSFMLVREAERASVPLVYDAHNVEAVRFRRMGQSLPALIVRIAENHLCQHAAAILTVSKEDQALMYRHYRRKSTLLPNGVDTTYFSPGKRDPELMRRYDIGDEPIALFVGAFDYGPNVEALGILTHDIWPSVTAETTGARLIVVGREPPQWVHGVQGVLATGSVEDIVSHIRLANVVVVPLLRGGGTRLKIVEALACGQTVLSTPAGAEGIEADENHGLFRIAIGDFARQLTQLLKTPLRPCSNIAARMAAEEYAWDIMIKKVNWEAIGRTSS